MRLREGGDEVEVDSRMGMAFSGSRAVGMLSLLRSTCVTESRSEDFLFWVAMIDIVPLRIVTVYRRIY